MSGAIDTRSRQRQTLSAFRQTLRQESHTLRDHPQLLWQQTYNRLRWSAPELEPSALPPALVEPEHDWLRVVNYPASYAFTSLLVIETGGGTARCCTVSRDGAVLVTGSGDGLLRAWDLRSGNLLTSVEAHGGSSVACCTPMTDDGTFLTGGGDGSVALWRLPDLALELRIPAHDAGIAACSLHPDLGRIVTAADDVRVFDLSGEHIATFREHTRGLLGCGLVDGDLAVSADSDRIYGWRPDTGRVVWRADSPIGTLTWCEGCLTHLDVHPHTRTFVTGSLYGVVRLWDADAGDQIREIARFEGCVNRVAFSLDGGHVAVAGGSSYNDDLDMTQSDNGVHVYPVGEALEPAPDACYGHSGDVEWVAFASDHRHVVSAGRDGTARLWEPRAGTVKGAFHHERSVWECCFTPDGASVFSAGGDGRLRSFDSATLSKTNTHMAFSHTCVMVRLSPDGRYVLGKGQDMGLISPIIFRVDDHARDKTLVEYTNSDSTQPHFEIQTREGGLLQRMRWPKRIATIEEIAKAMGFAAWIDAADRSCDGELGVDIESGVLRVSRGGLPVSELRFVGSADISCASFSPTDPRLMVCGDLSGQLYLLRVEAGTPRRRDAEAAPGRVCPNCAADVSTTDAWCPACGRDL